MSAMNWRDTITPYLVALKESIADPCFVGSDRGTEAYRPILFRQTALTSGQSVRNLVRNFRRFGFGRRNNPGTIRFPFYYLSRFFFAPASSRKFLKFQIKVFCHNRGSATTDLSTKIQCAFEDAGPPSVPHYFSSTTDRHHAGFTAHLCPREPGLNDFHTRRFGGGVWKSNC
jgi:hypothetical protein